MPNPYRDPLGIAEPDLPALARHPESNVYSLLIVALLEHGAPLTLDEVAARFERAGIAPATRARRSLARCRPDRPPVHRDGDRDGLDPVHEERAVRIAPSEFLTTGAPSTTPRGASGGERCATSSSTMSSARRAGRTRCAGLAGATPESARERPVAGPGRPRLNAAR